MALDNFRFIRGKIEFYRTEIATLRRRREELADEMVAKGMSTELATSIIGLDELREKEYESLIKLYEDMILVLEVLANVKADERLPRA